MSDSDFNMFYYKKRLLDKANKIGFHTGCFILEKWDTEIIMIYQKLRKILCLANNFSYQRLEKACERAYFYKKEHTDIIKMILKQGLDALPMDLNTDIFGQYKLKFDKK